FFCFPSLAFEVFQPDAASGADTVTCLLNASKETWVMLETIFEPIVFGFKTDQNAGRLAMSRDDDLLPLCFPKEAGEIIFDFRQRNFLHSGLANCASHDSASDFATIAKISTVVRVTS